MGFDWGNALKGGGTGFAAGGPVGGIVGGALGGFLGGGDPTKKANKYLDQIPPELRKYLEPYINAGHGALGHLNDISGEYEKMYQDPNAIISRIGSGYQKSPGYDWQLNQGENAITNAAAANGMAGTGQHQQQAGELATNLANQDYQNYLAKALGLYAGGVSGRAGIEQNIFDTGAGASGSLAANLAKILEAKAGLSYQNELNKNQQNSDLFSSIASRFGDLFK